MKALTLLIYTIERTGGVVQLSDCAYAPMCDVDWIDLGKAYMLACAETDHRPMVVTGY